MSAKLINYVIKTFNVVATILKRLQKPQQNKKTTTYKSKEFFPTGQRIWNYPFIKLTTFHLGNVDQIAKYSSKIIHCSKILISCKAEAGAGPYQLQRQYTVKSGQNRVQCLPILLLLLHNTNLWTSILFAMWMSVYRSNRTTAY